MSTFHPATSSLANFDLYESILRLHLIKTRTYVCHGITDRALLDFLPANSYTTHLLSSTRATNEGIAHGFGGVVNFSFAIKRILGIKRIFPCSFANKRMRLLTRVYGIVPSCGIRHWSKTKRHWNRSRSL